MKPIRAIDLCCGAGGWACAARGLPIEIELAVDLWPVACRTYKLNHPQTQLIRADLREPATRERVLADCRGIELILGGIPCEWLSLYRRFTKVSSEELAEQRATLDSVLSLVAELSPRWYCLEDVKGLVKELPILAPWAEINADGYSAQRRKRVFVGHFPQPAPQRNPQLLKDKIRPGPYRIGVRAIDRTEQRSRTFSSETVLAADLDRKSPTIINNSSRRDAEMVIVDSRLPGGKRQMEWQEAAVIQGFPEDYLFVGSPTDVAAMVGRAVQIDTARAILQAIVRQRENSP